MEAYIEIWVFLVIGLSFPLINFFFSWLLRPHYPDQEKTTTYESGEIPLGDARVRFNIRYYVFALIFVVFDVETVFLYPWAVVFEQIGLFGFVAMLLFILTLVEGLIYAWKKGVLKWV